jgi:hypothetical protein
MLSVFSTITTAQIAITEVYYNTPYSESKKRIPSSNTSNKYSEHHLGEFIELYNYTTEDIPLNGWYLRDNAGVYYFPADAVIKSGDFLLVAYKPFDSQYLYFPKFFPNTKGQETKILYQFRLVLNNLGEKVKLFTSGNGLLKDVLPKDKPPLSTVLIDVDKVQWENTGLLPSNYDKKSSIGDGSTANYNINSLQRSGENSYNENNKTNPLTALYKPAMVNYQDVPLVKNFRRNNYARLTWSQYVDRILKNTCNYPVPITEQSNSSYVLTTTKQCFKHDAAGNMDVKENCSSTTTSTTSSAANLQNDPEQIKNRIKIYPNPVSSLVTLTWDNEVNNLISQMKIVALNGAYTVSVPKNASGYTFTADLTLQPKGIYVLIITLNSGQTLSKSIVKI